MRSFDKSFSTLVIDSCCFVAKKSAFGEDSIVLDVANAALAASLTGKGSSQVRDSWTSLHWVTGF